MKIYKITEASEYLDAIFKNLEITVETNLMEFKREDRLKIFETNKKDVILLFDRILEVEKYIHPTRTNGKYSLQILTSDTTKIINYENKEDRDTDYEKIKQGLLAMDAEEKAKKAKGRLEVEGFQTTGYSPAENDE